MTSCACVCFAFSSRATVLSSVADSHGAATGLLSARVVRLVVECTSLGVEEEVEEILIPALLASDVADLLVFIGEPEVEA